MLVALRSRFLVALVLTGGLVATPMLLGAPAQARHHRHRHRTIRVIDDQFAPARIRVHRGTIIAWKWSSQNVNSHNVKLTKGPRHVRHFHSRTATTNFTFRRRLTRRGRYHYLCTFHVGMRGTIRVVR